MSSYFNSIAHLAVTDEMVIPHYTNAARALRFKIKRTHDPIMRSFLEGNLRVCRLALTRAKTRRLEQIRAA